jgi:hypothetical protein
MRVNAGVSTPLLNICKGMYDYVIHMMQCMIRLSSVDTVISKKGVVVMVVMAKI